MFQKCWKLPDGDSPSHTQQDYSFIGPLGSFTGISSFHLVVSQVSQIYHVQNWNLDSHPAPESIPPQVTHNSVNDVIFCAAGQTRNVGMSILDFFLGLHIQSNLSPMQSVHFLPSPLGSRSKPPLLAPELLQKPPTQSPFFVKPSNHSPQSHQSHHFKM